MLKEVLQAIAQDDRVFSLDHLAQQVGIHQDLLKQILTDLVRAGYLRALGETCSQECDHCPLISACLTTQPLKVWVLTEKGIHFIRKQAINR